MKLREKYIVAALLLCGCATLSASQVDRALVRAAAAFCSAEPSTDGCEGLSDSELTLDEKLALAKAILAKAK